jgi:hypothetical protein
MPGSGSEQRNSRALEAPLIADPKARAAAEARNGLRQYDAGIKTVQTALERGVFKLRLSLILALHREALAGISSYGRQDAGYWKWVMTVAPPNAAISTT